MATDRRQHAKHKATQEPITQVFSSLFCQWRCQNLGTKKMEENSHKRTEKNVNTLNQLDEEFQLSSEHDPEHIFPKEKEMLNELREKREFLKKENEKLLAFFLCCRRHNIPEVLEVIDKFYEKKKQYGWFVEGSKGKNWPEINDISFLVQNDLLIPPIMDLHGRLIWWLNIGKIGTQNISLDQFYAWVDHRS